MSAIDPSVFERHLAQRIVFLGTEIDDDVAQRVIAQLLYLQSLDRARDITLYVSSPGGVVTSALAIHDAMTTIAPPIATFGVGQAAGVAALILAAGARGKRYASPNTRIGLSACAPAPDSRTSEIAARELRRLNLTIRDRLSRHTRVDLTTIETAMTRETWMTAEQARDFGLIDAIADRPLGTIG